MQSTETTCPYESARLAIWQGAERVHGPDRRRWPKDAWTAVQVQLRAVNQRERRRARMEIAR